MNLAARTGQKYVYSYERECPLMNAAVGSSERTDHESHIVVDEWQSQTLARTGVGARHHP
jgi:hypothetical protein